MKLISFTAGAQLPHITNYPKGQIANWCDFNDGNKIFFVGLPNVTAQEIEVFKNGEMLLGAYNFSKVMVTTGQIYQKGNKRQTLMGFESIYHPNINNEGAKQPYVDELATLENGSVETIEIDFVLFDTVTNIVKAIRVIQCDTNFSKKLLTLLATINEQDLTHGEFVALTNKVHQYPPEKVFEFTTARLKVEQR